MKVPYTEFDRLFVGGDWIAADAREAILNPATEDVIGEAPVGDPRATEAALAAARHAFDNGPWPRLSQRERAAYMQKMHDALIQRRSRIRELLIAEVGCSQGIIDIVQFGACMEHFQAAIHLSLTDETVHLPTENSVNLSDPTGPRILGGGEIVREPVGVVAGITAYNFPFLLNLSKIVPALLTGNTLVLKPSPFTPFSALLFGEVAQEIGLPAGVLNIVTGGADVGTMLTSDPRIDMVTFTGSEGVGIAIMAQAAPTLKRVHLELGGKSAMIVRADADVQQAAISAVANLTINSGQGCALMTRFLVHNSIRPAFVATMKAVADNWKIGDPADANVLMGPLIRETQRQRVEKLVQSGKDSGATLVRGGGRVPGLDKGFFYDITLFDDVDNASELAQEEVFGPVGVTIGFDRDEEAVKLANESRFGLSGSILSADSATAYDMAKQIRTGTVHINGGMGKMGFGPLGGYKRSGLGREYGPGWLKEFTQEKSIFYPIGRP